MKCLWCLFFFFLAFIVEWVDYNHGKAESWPQFLAVTDILYDSGQETWLQPHAHYRVGPGRSEAQRFVQGSSILVFHQIRRLSSRQFPSHMCHCQSP